MHNSRTDNGNDDVRKSSHEVRQVLYCLNDTSSNEQLIQPSSQQIIPIEEIDRILDADLTLTNEDSQSYLDKTPIPSPLSESFGIEEDNINFQFNDSLASDPASDNCSLSSNNRNSANLGNISSYDSSGCSSVENTPTSSRKRRIRKDEWKDIKRKYLKNLGKAYSSKKDGVQREGKTIKFPCPSSCRLKCYEKFSFPQRESIFNAFWRLGDHCRQWDYIAKYVEVIDPATTTSRTVSRRKKTLKYHLPLTEPNTDIPKNVMVCKTMFLNTLSVGERTVNTALSKWCSGGGTISPDKRGGVRVIVIDDEIKQGVINHVKTFQPIESHYVRKKSTKLYLDGELTFTKMFTLYNEWCATENITKKAKTVRQYRDIINQNLNISFHKPKKDICNECHIYDANKNTMTEEDKQKQEQHLKSKTLSREMKEIDKNEAIKSNGKIITACFDFQKILNCPHGNVGLFYYKRKLSIFNFTVFDLANKEGYCYMWPEINAKHGACEVASCLLKFIETKVNDGAKEFRFWSDNCAGQNRNRIVFAFYTYAAKKYGVTITHRFLERGHTQNEADSVHALIERNAKNKLIYTPEQWYALVRWSKVNPPYYHVVEMSITDFYNFKKLLEGKNWLKNSNKQKMTWNKIKEVHITSNDPHLLKYRYSFESEECMTLHLTKKSYSSRRNNLETINTTLDLCNTDYLPITAAKFDDLMSLCNGRIIPQEYRNYYDRLPNTRNTIDEEHTDIDSSDDL